MAQQRKKPPPAGRRPAKAAGVGSIGAASITGLAAAARLRAAMGFPLKAEEAYRIGLDGPGAGSRRPHRRDAAAWRKPRFSRR